MLLQKSEKNNVCERNYIWNPYTCPWNPCTCKNGQYLQKIIGDSVIM